MAGIQEDGTNIVEKRRVLITSLKYVLVVDRHNIVIKIV